MIYKMYTTTVGDAAAQLDFRGDGYITAVFGILSADLDADAEFAMAEVAWGSTPSYVTHDTQSSVFMLRTILYVAAAGQDVTTVNGSAAPIRIPYGAGERIYLHTTALGPANVFATFYLYCEEGQSSRPPVRRR